MPGNHLGRMEAFSNGVFAIAITLFIILPMGALRRR
jgi:uncharacterized membrane protein